MALERISQWFLSDKGKRFTYFAAGAAASGAMLLTVLPHTLLIEQYKDFMHLYKNGFTVPVSKKLLERFQKALELLEVPDADKHLYKPFSVFGFDIFSAGSSYSKMGVIIGLPANFSYESTDDVDRQGMRLRETSIAWDTDEGRLLLKSLVLSEKAQLYAMAREIKFRDMPKTLIDTGLATVAIIGHYGLTNTINQRLGLYGRPMILRAIMYGLVAGFSFGNYALCKDFSQVYFENKVDTKLKEIPVLREGAKEFYAKTMMKNVALRTILGKDGEKIYNTKGNENFLFRYKHIPLDERKAFFETS